MGVLSVEEAEELLRDHPPGTFMIHFLESKLNVFLVCSYVKKPHTVKHYLLQKVHSGYVVSKYKSTEHDERTAPSSLSIDTTTNNNSNSTTITNSNTITNNNTTTTITNSNTTTTNSNNTTTITNSNTTTTTNINIANTSTNNSNLNKISQPKNVQLYSSFQEFIRANRHHLRYNYDSDGIPTLRVQRLPVEGEQTTAGASSTAGVTTASTPLNSNTPRLPTSTNSSRMMRGEGELSNSNTPHSSLNNHTTASSQSPTLAQLLSMVVDLTGSDVPNESVRRLYGNVVCAQSVATYPQDSLGYQVICDWFKVRLLPRVDRVIVAIADGCNWGMRPREAAQRACHAFVEFLSQPHVQSQIRDTRDCRHFLLRAMAKAHDKIIEGKADPFDAGTTTLLGGILLKINEQDYDFNEWAFVCVGVGDCKAFVWNHLTQTVVDITQGNRTPTQDISDCGGRLGPYLRGGLPDLRNLACYFWPCKEGDILLLVTDGVHDNLNPQILGKLPSDVGLTAPNNEWKNVPHEEADRVKAHFQLEILATLLNQNKEKSPFQFTHALIQHCLKTTNKARAYMEKNPTKPEPNNYVEYPGKMDHATCVTVRVGSITSDNNVSTAKNPILHSTSNTLSTTISTAVSTRRDAPTTPPLASEPPSTNKEPRSRGFGITRRLIPKKDKEKSHKKNPNYEPMTSSSSGNVNNPSNKPTPSTTALLIPSPHLDAITRLFEQKLTECIHSVPSFVVRKYNITLIRLLSSIADKGLFSLLRSSPLFSTLLLSSFVFSFLSVFFKQPSLISILSLSSLCLYI
jgi:hypothetical protein